MILVALDPATNLQPRVLGPARALSLHHTRQWTPSIAETLTEDLPYFCTLLSVSRTSQPVGGFGEEEGVRTGCVWRLQSPGLLHNGDRLVESTGLGGQVEGKNPGAQEDSRTKFKPDPRCYSLFGNSF